MAEGEGGQARNDSTENTAKERCGRMYKHDSARESEVDDAACWPWGRQLTRRISCTQSSKEEGSGYWDEGDPRGVVEREKAKGGLYEIIQL